MKIETKKKHWTERSIKDYLFRIVADFIAQLENKIESLPISQDELAKRWGVTKGRVSQVLNHPGNFTLAKIIEYTRALGMKVSIIAYEDDDPENRKGPINPEVFRICWEKTGKPRDLWAFQKIGRQGEVAANSTTSVIYMSADVPIFLPIPTGQISGLNVENIPRYYVGETVSTPTEIKDRKQFDYIQQEG
jgi:predicted XRE-type DNA-binding protein